MAESSFVLSRARWPKVDKTQYQVAILPWGATESHNTHLPYSTDNAQVTYLAEKAAELAWGQGAKVMVLPTIPFGVQSAQLDIKFNLNLRPSTQLAVLRDLVESLERQKIPKLLIINGHGGNHFSSMLRELYLDTKVMMVTTDWYKAVKPEAYFDQVGDHADEMETSLMMHIAPDLVAPLSEAGSGRSQQIRIPSLREGWAWTQRAWLGKVTFDTGVGSPAKASAEKGKAYADAVIQKLATLMVELSSADLEDLYEETPAKK